MRTFVQLSFGTPVAWDLAPASVRELAPANTGFPADAKLYDEIDLREFGFWRYHYAPMPTYFPETEEVVIVPPRKVDGKWTQQWEVRTLSVERIAATKEANRARAITLFDFRKGVIKFAGAVEAAIAVLPDAKREMMLLRWNLSPQVGRRSLLVTFVQETATLTDEQMDAIFEAVSNE